MMEGDIYLRKNVRHVRVITIEQHLRERLQRPLRQSESILPLESIQPETDEPGHLILSEFDHDLTGQIDQPQSAEMSDPLADELLDEIIVKQRMFPKGRAFGPFPFSPFKKRGEDDSSSAT